MKHEHQLALSEIEAIVQQAQPSAARLGAVCRVLQSLPGYTGVYLYALKGDTLVLKAFHGRATQHTRIPSGQGICGASVQTRAPVIVDDVNSDSRYLACNLETKSEIVFPIVRGDTYLAQIDVDSDDTASFGAEDKAFLGQVAARLQSLF
ncbi:MAG: GAF domain-containing protein [Gammaproteobacteria bacterium]